MDPVLKRKTALALNRSLRKLSRRYALFGLVYGISRASRVERPDSGPKYKFELQPIVRFYKFGQTF